MDSGVTAVWVGPEASPATAVERHESDLRLRTMSVEAVPGAVTDADCIACPPGTELDGTPLPAAVDVPVVVVRPGDGDPFPEGAADTVSTDGRDWEAVLARRLLVNGRAARAATGAVVPGTADSIELARYRRLVEALPDVVYTTDADGRFLSVNEPAIRELTGYSGDELVGEHFSLLVDEAEAERGVRLVSRLLERDERTATWTPRVVRKDGESVPCENHLGVVTGPDGDLEAVVGIIRDVSGRERRRERFEALHDAAAELAEASSEATVAGVVLRTARDLFDLPTSVYYRYDAESGTLRPAEGTERVAADAVPSIESGDHEFATFREGHPTVYNVDAEAVDLPVRTSLLLPLGDHGLVAAGTNEPRDYEESTLDAASVLARHATTALDRIAERRRLSARERTLERQNERLEEFARVVSHDLRNPLNVAAGNVQLAGEGDEEALAKAGTALDRMEQLVDDLLTLAREGQAAGDREPVDVARVAERALATADADLRLDAESVRVAADPVRLRGVFENLARNADEHGGADRLRVGPLDGGGFYVADDGDGIPEAERGKVTEPGYSTADRGTGFGLSIVRAVAEAHDWRLDVTESADGGARFEFRPVATEGTGADD
jgi:PAS domain S-box-containing protein